MGPHTRLSKRRKDVDGVVHGRNKGLAGPNARHGLKGDVVLPVEVVDEGEQLR